MVTVRASPNLGGEIQVGFTFLKKFQGGEDDSESENDDDDQNVHEENSTENQNDNDVQNGALTQIAQNGNDGQNGDLTQIVDHSHLPSSSSHSHPSFPHSGREQAPPPIVGEVLEKATKKKEKKHLVTTLLKT